MNTSPQPATNPLRTTTRASRARRFGLFVASAAALTLFVAAPAGAQTYSDGSDGSTGQGSDPGNTTQTTTPSSPDPGDTGNTADPGDTGNTGNTGGDSDPVAQVDDDNGDLAFTGTDSISLALIGAAVAGAGALLVVSSRRKVELTA